MKFVPNAVSVRAARTLLVGQKHSPTILFAGGVVAGVASTVMACRATLQLEERLDQHLNNLKVAHDLRENDPGYSEKDFQSDRTKIYIRSAVSVCRLYTPALLLGGVAIAALTGSHKILSNRNAALTAAYAAVEKAFGDYRGRVREEFGEDKDREFRHGSKDVTFQDEETGKTRKGKAVDDALAPSMYARVFDETNRNFVRNPEYNFMFLRTQQNWANDKLKAQGHLFLNEVYDMLGMERSKAGAVVGWVFDPERPLGDNYVDFGIFDGNNPRAVDFMIGVEGSVWLDFNVDGVVYDKI